MTAISSSDITVIVQGAIAGKPSDPPRLRMTQRALRSLRRHLPQAKIVLSTWMGSNTDGLDFDELVLSEDPGAPQVPREGNSRPQFYNVNRQALSTRAGLVHADRAWVLKWRSDILMQHDGITRFHHRYPARDLSSAVGQERLIASSYFSPWPYRMQRQAFSISDWVMLGTQADMHRYWCETPVYPDEWVGWLKDRPELVNPHHNEPQRYVVEQHCWLSYLRQKFDVPMEHVWDFGSHNAVMHLQSIANNVIIASPKQLGVRFTKYGFGMLNAIAMTSHNDWRYLYRLCCDPLHRGVPTLGHWLRGRLADIVDASPRLMRVLQQCDYHYTRATLRWWQWRDRIASPRA
jgi:hypothetical protein